MLRSYGQTTRDHRTHRTAPSTHSQADNARSCASVVPCSRSRGVPTNRARARGHAQEHNNNVSATSSVRARGCAEVLSIFSVAPMRPPDKGGALAIGLHGAAVPAACQPVSPHEVERSDSQSVCAASASRHVAESCSTLSWPPLRVGWRRRAALSRASCSESFASPQCACAVAAPPTRRRPYMCTYVVP